VRYIEPTSFSDPEKAARKLIEIANAAESVQDQRVHIELINLPFLRAGGSPDEYRAGLERAISNGFSHKESLATDPDLDSIRKTPWFQAIAKGIPAS